MYPTEMEPDLLAGANATYGIALRPLPFFRQSEQVDFEGLWLLADLIAGDGRWRKRIVVESTLGIIMDGNHRLRAAMRLGLKAVPCILLRYGDPRVRVRDWNTGEPFEIAHIFRTIAAGALLPYKTHAAFLRAAVAGYGGAAGAAQGGELSCRWAECQGGACLSSRKFAIHRTAARCFGSFADADCAAAETPMKSRLRQYRVLWAAWAQLTPKLSPPLVP